jgi:hypothetical protein
VLALERFRAISYSSWLFGSEFIKAHTAPVASFLLHRTRIGKGAMKKFGMDSQRRGELFLIFIFHLSIGKATLNYWKSVLPALSREQWVLFGEKIR